jgi:hypothetical protein
MVKEKGRKEDSFRKWCYKDILANKYRKWIVTLIINLTKF